MDPQMSRKPTWEIDQRLAALVGCPIRVRADSLIPKGWNGELLKHPINDVNLVLPDGTKIEGDPVYVEGILREFSRRIAVLFANLDPLPFEGTAEGRVLFRGTPAVILRAPATVQFHHSQFVERLPTDEKSYWQHLVANDPQMNLRFGD